MYDVLVTGQPLSFSSQDESTDFQYDEAFAPTNVMDRWILSFTQSLILFVKEEMKSEILSWNFTKLSIFLFSIVYRLYTVVPRLVRFIDQLTNWYVRFNRKRLKVNFSCTAQHFIQLMVYPVIW